MFFSKTTLESYALFSNSVIDFSMTCKLQYANHVFLEQTTSRSYLCCDGLRL